MLTHTNFCSNVTDSCANVKFESKDDVAISFLPLAHVYGRTLDYVHLFHGITIAYVEAVEQVAQALLEIHPTLLAAVPRVFEKIYARVVEQGSKQTGLKRKIFDWAMEVASRSALWRSGEHNTTPSVKLSWKSRRQAGLFEDSRGNRRKVAPRFFRRRAACERARGIFLGGGRPHLSRLWTDGNRPGSDFQLPAKQNGQFGQADSQCRAAHRRRRRNPRQEALASCRAITRARKRRGKC